MAKKNKKNKKQNIPARPPADTQSAHLVQLHSEIWKAATNGLTPTRLNRVLADADSGDIVAQHQLFSDMLDRDEHIMSELGKRGRALLGLNWDITPIPQMADNAGAKKIAETIKSIFDGIGDFEGLILSLADGIGHGFSALEIEWELKDNVWLPREFHHRLQSWFLIKDGNLRLRDGSQDGLELEPYGWVIHRHPTKIGSLARSGLLRTLCWTFLLKAYARGYWSRFLEVHGLPVRLGKYGPYATEEEKRVLMSALRNLGHDAAGIVPAGTEIEFKEALKASHTPFADMIGYCEKKQSVAILGGTLTSQADGKTSTNALGRIHENVKDDILKTDAICIAATITRQILAPLALFNLRVTDANLLPWFTFDITDPADLSSLADSLPKLAGIMPKIGQKWAHEKTGIPVADDKEPVLTPPGPASPLNMTSLTANRREQDSEHDDPIDDITFRNSQAAMEQLLAPLINELKNGMEPEELLLRLSSLYPALDSKALQEQMARAIFVTDVWGRLAPVNK